MKNFNFKSWLENFKEELINEFNEQLLYIGLQGSYARKEANKDSDIDLVVILNEVNTDILKRYKNIIKSMPYYDKCCGFISGINEINHWSKSDVFQFYYETENIYGDLKKIVSKPAKEDIKIAIKTGAENIYHSSCHAFLYENNYVEILSNLYKMAFFILQAKYFLEKNVYISTKNQLLNYLKGRDKEILEVCINRDKINNQNFEDLFGLLLNWSVDLI